MRAVLNGTTQPQLRIFRSLVKLDAAKGLPSKIKILNWGKNENAEGLTVILNEASVAAFNANQTALGRNRVALDFEHNTVPGTEEYKRTSEPRPVAAFGAPLIVPGEGMFLETLNWTPDGERSARNFEDLSAAPFLDKDGVVIALHSAALTKAGAVYDLPSFLGQVEIAAMSATLSKINHQQKNDMSQKMISLAMLAAVLGLPETSEESAVTTKLKERLSPVDLSGLDNRLKTIEAAGNKGIATLSATIDGKVVTLNAEDVVKLHAQVQTLSATLKASQENTDAAERTHLIEQATSEGKVIPLAAETIKTLSTAALRELIGGLPANVVPLSKRGKGGGEKGFGDLTGLAKAIAAHKANPAA